MFQPVIKRKKTFQEHFIVLKEDETYIKGVFFPTHYCIKYK